MPDRTSLEWAIGALADWDRGRCGKRTSSGPCRRDPRHGGRCTVTPRTTTSRGPNELNQARLTIEVLREFVASEVAKVGLREVSDG